MNRTELFEYLERIGLDSLPPLNERGLALVQRAHLETVPFENLDIVTGRIPLALDEASLFQKIVRERRGGLCYELNILLTAALRAMGFKVAMLGGRHPKYGDDLDHVFLRVMVRNDDTPRLADVGFAANFAKPLKLVVGATQNDGRDRFRLDPAPEVGEGYVRIVRIPGLEDVRDEEEEMFTFGPREYEPEDCQERCDWFSTAPESRFTQGPLVCIDGTRGRLTLSAGHFIETHDGYRTGLEITSADQFRSYLRDTFDLGHVDVSALA